MQDTTTPKKECANIAGTDTLTTWMLISIAGVILAIFGGVLGSWPLLAASCACLLIFAAKVAKFYTLPISDTI